MILINETDDILHIDGTDTWFWCPECKQVHLIPLDDVNKTTAGNEYVVVCPKTGVCVTFPIKE